MLGVPPVDVSVAHVLARFASTVPREREKVIIFASTSAFLLFVASVWQRNV